MRTPIVIEDLAPGGEGKGRAGERPVFVPYTAPGDHVVAELEPGEGAGHAGLVRVEVAGPDRVEAPCRHFGPRDAEAPHGAPGPDRECGGCEWQHVDYRRQLAAKERMLAETLRRIGRLAPGSYALAPAVGSPRPYRYRNRARFHLDRDAARLVYFRRRSHLPVRVEECHLLEPGLDALREAMGPALAAARLSPSALALEWSELEGKGTAWLKVPDVTASVRARAEAVVAAVPALAGLLLEAEGTAPVAVGEVVLRHARVPGDPEAGTQRSRPDVFQQANRGANALLVDAVLGLLGDLSGLDVLELHCGAGNFTAPLAARARSVWAVELQGPSLELARADLAGRNVRFFAGDALKLALAFSREPGGPGRFGAALLDPPREGAKGIGPALRDLAVPRAVYVSCDPATFARDLRACGEVGFRVERVVPVDMFPQTHHVEGVALLVR